METITISKDKFGVVISDVEKLVSHFEDLVQDKVVEQRLGDKRTSQLL